MAAAQIYRAWKAFRLDPFGIAVVILRIAARNCIQPICVSSWAQRVRDFRDKGFRHRASPRKTALIAHVFYPDLLSEVLECYRRMPEGTVLIVTTPPDRIEAIRGLLPAFAILIPCENRGRDIAPFIRLLNEGYLDIYDAVLKLHTKRSPHIHNGDLDRRILFTALAGSRRRVDSILRLFKHKQVGIVGWRSAWMYHDSYWMANRANVAALADRMETHLPEHPAFFRGSMFWFRPSAFERLRKLSLNSDDFEEEIGQIDGTLHHAVERSFCIAAAAESYHILDLRGQRLL